MNVLHTLNTFLDNRVNDATTAYADAYYFAGTPIWISSSSDDVVTATRRIMGVRTASQIDTPAASHISATLNDGLWTITADGNAECHLPQATAPPLIAEALITTACKIAAHQQGKVLIRGAVLAKNGVGIALTGQDLSSTTALALHLHARQWTGISFSYSFFDRRTQNVDGLHSLATVSSRAIDDVPRQYRRAIEASKWYFSGGLLTFYNVNPFLVTSHTATSTYLSGVLLIDGTADETPAIDEFVSSAVHPSFGIEPQELPVRIATLIMGSPIASCDAIERWTRTLTAK